MAVDTKVPSDALCISSDKVPVTPDEDLEYVSAGTSGVVKLRHDRMTVVKHPWPDSKAIRGAAEDLRREYAVYVRIGQHPRLLRLHHESTLERLVLPYLKNGCLRTWLKEKVVPPHQRRQFAADAAEGLHALHGGNVMHSDLSTWNYMVTDDERLCIIDFAGSTLDGQIGSGWECIRNYLPRPISDVPDIRTDIFALGSVLYEIATNEVPYAECEEEEVDNRYRRKEFPATDHLPFGKIILSCWQVNYESANHIFEDIKALSDVASE